MANNGQFARARTGGLSLALLAVCLPSLLAGCSGTTLEPWHNAKLSEEFNAGKAEQVRSFADYQELEDRLFAQLESEVYARSETGPEHQLVRYSAGSAADPRENRPDWNRSFELKSESPIGGVLLLHGMSDSPYSLRALAQTLGERGFWVVGLRLPGHGTAPSGLKHVRVRDMVSAVQLAMRHLARVVGSKPIHMVGYSTGATLALNFALDAADTISSPAPASLVLISPAIRIHPTAALARFKNWLSILPGLGGLAWLQVLPEFDPYKFNSFATNAGDVVHQLTRSVDQRVAARAREAQGPQLPPILVFKSTVDSTVTTEAVVDRLLARLAPDRHELVLFDINRFAATRLLLIGDPGPLTRRLMQSENLPFGLAVVGNESPTSQQVGVRYRAPLSAGPDKYERLDLRWPPGVVSLSHVALPFPPDDPLYGQHPPANEERLFLGDLAVKGERGLLALPTEWLLRMRYNPFYELIERNTLQWLEAAR